MFSTVYKDGAAVALSTACILHCVALPVLAISTPFFAAAAEAEWVHISMATLAIMASLSVVVSSRSSRVAEFLIPVGVGGALVMGALFAEHFDVDETLPTIVGGILIASAHLRRIYKLKQS